MLIIHLVKDSRINMPPLSRYWTAAGNKDFWVCGNLSACKSLFESLVAFDFTNKVNISAHTHILWRDVSSDGCPSGIPALALDSSSTFLDICAFDVYSIHIHCYIVSIPAPELSSTVSGVCSLSQSEHLLVYCMKLHVDWQQTWARISASLFLPAWDTSTCQGKDPILIIGNESVNLCVNCIVLCLCQRFCFPVACAYDLLVSLSLLCVPL